MPLHAIPTFNNERLASLGVLPHPVDTLACTAAVGTLTFDAALASRSAALDATGPGQAQQTMGLWEQKR